MRRTYETESPQPRTKVLSGNFTVGSDGAIAAQTGVRISGGTVTYDEGSEGRYIVTLDRKYKRIQGAGAAMLGPDTAAMTTTDGTDPVVRTIGVSLFRIQFTASGTKADTDPASGNGASWWAIVSTV